ncbi:MAG: DsrE family protein [Chloroflexi bacterium]|nr:DsrE family protein [Chloroflexota bacterium]
MKMGVVIYSGDAEMVWNALRFANFALAQGDQVSVFLLGKGVEIESLDHEVFKVKEQLQAFLGGGGKVMACGTCLEIHKVKPTQSYAVAKLEDLYRIIKESDRALTF